MTGDPYHILQVVTPEALQPILVDLRLELQIPLEQLCREMIRELRLSIMIGLDVGFRTNLAFYGVSPRGGIDRKNNVQVQKELAVITHRARGLAEDITSLSSEAKSVLTLYAQDMQFDQNLYAGLTEWDRLWDVVGDLRRIADFLERTEAVIARQSPRWVEAEKQEQRIFHALYLAPIFEKAFGKSATVIAWRDEIEGAWPPFFQAIMRLAFGEEKVPNLEKVLDEARRRHLIMQAPI